MVELMFKSQISNANSREIFYGYLKGIYEHLSKVKANHVFLYWWCLISSYIFPIYKNSFKNEEIMTRLLFKLFISCPNGLSNLGVIKLPDDSQLRSPVIGINTCELLLKMIQLNLKKKEIISFEA
jgi:hypothetical protein